MKKQILAMLMVAVLAVGMLTACGDKKPDPTAEGTTVYTITLAHDLTGAAAETLSTYLAKFTEAFPQIQVETIATADITDGNTPNVLLCLPDRVAELAAANKLVTLDSFVDTPSMMLRADGALAPMNISSDEQDDLLDVFYQEGIADGKLYSLPVAKSEQVLYYNQTYFEENELNTPLSWESVEKACAAIKALDPDSIPLCIDDPSAFFVTMCAQYGGEYTSADGEILFNNEENRSFIKRFHDWYQKGYVTTSTLMGRSSAGSINAEDTRHYMVVGSSGDAAAQKPEQDKESYAFELGILPFPQLDYESRQVLARGPNVCIYKGDDDDLIDCAWMLVRYLVADIEFQARFAEAAGLMPVMESALLDEQFSTYLDSADGGSNVSALAALACIEQQTYLFTTPVFDGSATAYAQVGSLLDKCLTIAGDHTDTQIEAAFQDAVKACN